MAQDPGFDVSKAQRYFSADCFNKAWDGIEKPDRTPEEDEQMIRLNQASIWHWTQREDCNSTNMSIGYWQASRIYAILQRPAEAVRYGQLCLQNSHDEAPFFLAYAYEALARAEQVAGNVAMVGKYRAEALRLIEAVTDPEDRKVLMNDLDTIK